MDQRSAGCAGDGTDASEPGGTERARTKDGAGGSLTPARHAPWRHVISGGEACSPLDSIFADLGGIPFMNKSYLSF